MLDVPPAMVNETVEVGEAIRGSDRDWIIVVVTAMRFLERGLAVPGYITGK